jgi:phosphatidylglycerophosphate synthase
MSNSAEHTLKLEAGDLGFLKRNLADFLTFSRVIIGLTVLSLSFMGKSAYLTVVVLTLVGALSDVLDGKVARRYLGMNGEGKLGKYEHEIDNFFILCVMGYLSFSEVVIPRAMGLGWIALVLIAFFLFKRDHRVLAISVVPTEIALLVIACIYNTLIFMIVIAPAMTIGIIANRRRVRYLIFEYCPSLFSK